MFAKTIPAQVPNFMMALAIVSETDFVTALPRRFAAVHAARFGVVSVEAPLRLPRFQIRAITQKVALADAGLAWLFEGDFESCSQIRQSQKVAPTLTGAMVSHHRT